MSIFDRDCAEAASGLICAHIEQFYKGLGGDPPVFYLLDENELPAGFVMTPTPSDSGDVCHFEVDGCSNKRLYKAFKDKCGWQKFHTCENGEIRPLAEADVKAFQPPG